MKKLRVNMVSESDVSVQGHGVHTAYEEMCRSLRARPDITLIKGEFNTKVDCDVIHFHTVGPRTFKKLRQKGPKKVMSAHVVPDSFVGSLVGARYWKPIAKWYLRWFYNHADLLLAVSEATANELRELHVKAPIEVLHNSIDTSRYHHGTETARRDLRKKLGIGNSSMVVIGAGQVQPRKRVDLFIQAAKKLPDVVFVWVGGIPFGRVAAEHADMTRLMTTAPENVIFPGMVKLEDMPDYYNMADLFWLPSEQETFGLVIIEAAASGLPVLLRNIPDYHSRFGDKVMYVTDKNFIATIEKFVVDTTLRRKYKKQALRLAEQFDSKQAAEELVQLYRNLL